MKTATGSLKIEKTKRKCTESGFKPSLESLWNQMPKKKKRKLNRLNNRLLDKTRIKNKMKP